MNYSQKFHVRQPYFDMINAGIKDIECRLYDEKRQKLKLGDIILFHNEDKTIYCKVTGLLIARDFEKLFELIDAKRTGLKDHETAVSTLQQFYDLQTQSEFGVVGIVVEKVA